MNALYFNHDSAIGFGNNADTGESILIANNALYIENLQWQTLRLWASIHKMCRKKIGLTIKCNALLWSQPHSPLSSPRTCHLAVSAVVIRNIKTGYSSLIITIINQHWQKKHIEVIYRYAQVRAWQLLILRVVAIGIKDLFPPYLFLFFRPYFRPSVNTGNQCCIDASFIRPYLITITCKLIQVWTYLLIGLDSNISLM